MVVYIRTCVCVFKPSIRIRKKGDLRDFECGMIVGGRQAGLSFSETVDTFIESLQSHRDTLRRFTDTY